MNKEKASLAPAKKALRCRLEQLAISENAKEALYGIALDPHGLEEKAATSFISSLLQVSVHQANQALLELTGRNLVITEVRERGPRLRANYEHLGIDENSKTELLSEDQPFQDQGQPHSESAMEALDDFFDAADEDIYVSLEITSHRVFGALERRAESGGMTVFLMPQEKLVPAARREHYREVLQEWIRFIKDGTAALKRNVRIRITEKAFPGLYTSAISCTGARFDLYFVGERTTRRGRILAVKNSTSLYEVIARQYEEAIRLSSPLWAIWWGDALLHWARRLVYPLVLLVVGALLASLRHPLAIVASALAIGLLVNFISSALGVRRWFRRGLFRRT